MVRRRGRSWPGRRASRSSRLVHVVQAMVRDDVRAAMFAVIAVASLMVPEFGWTRLAGPSGRAVGGDLVAVHARARAVLVRHHAHGAALGTLAPCAVVAALSRGRLLVFGAGAGAVAFALVDALGRGVVDRVIVMLRGAHVWRILCWGAASCVGCVHVFVELFALVVQILVGYGAWVVLRGLVS